MKFPIHEIWIDDDAVDADVTRRILRQLPAARVLSGPEVRQARRNLDLDPDPLSRGKRILRLMNHRGAFVKPCPGTPQYVCCGLQILHIGQGCPMDCRYCALQAYFNRRTLEVFVNHDDLIAGLRTHLEDHPDNFYRICTGEFTDSLALDFLTGLAPRLVDFLSRAGNAILEIKTKTDSIEPLLDLDPRRRVVLSFSVNSDQVCRTEEKGAASLDRRLDAAGRAQRSGYKIGLHFDPIIPHPGWESEYCRTVDAIFRHVDPSMLAWISLGVIRFVPDLKEAAAARFRPLAYYHDGFIRGLDGKFRLPAERRIAIYRLVTERIRKHHPSARIYLCMESPRVWKDSLGLDMESDAELARYLDAAFC